MPPRSCGGTSPSSQTTWRQTCLPCSESSCQRSYGIVFCIRPSFPCTRHAQHRSDELTILASHEAGLTRGQDQGLRRAGALTVPRRVEFAVRNRANMLAEVRGLHSRSFVRPLCKVSKREREREAARTPPCQARRSRMTTPPALSPTTCESLATATMAHAVRPKDSPGRVLGGRGWLADLIHSGSSRGPGGPSRLFCVPGIWRIAPFSQVKLCSRFH